MSTTPGPTFLTACLAALVCLQLYVGLITNSILRPTQQAGTANPPCLPELAAVLFRTDDAKDSKVVSNWLCWASRLGIQVHQIGALSAPVDTHNLLSQVRMWHAAGVFVAVATKRDVFDANLVYDLSTRLECDVFIYRPSARGGRVLTVARPTKAGAMFLETYLACALPAGGQGKSCLDHTMSALQNVTGTACHLLDGVVVAFKEIRPTFGDMGVYPSVVTFEQNVSTEAVVNQLKAVNLWLLPGDNHTHHSNDNCNFIDNMGTQAHQISHRAQRTSRSLHLTVRVLTMDRPAPLRRLVSSLARVDFLGDRVNLEVFVDYPDKTRLPWLQNTTAYNETLELARGWSWPHGRKSLRISSAPHGLANQWLQHADINATAGAGHSMLMVLEDDLELSQHFYSWLRDVTRSLLLDRLSRPNPQLLGIALERQHQSVGLGKRYQWLDSKPWLLDAMVGHASLYLSQQGSSWAPVFDVEQWNSFVDWSGVARVSGSTCVPGLFSNTWHAANNSDLWTPWLIKYMFDKGLYMAYFNYVSIFNDSAPPSLVVNHREYGAHYFRNEALGARPGERLVARQLVLDEIIEFQSHLAAMPVYDFFMRPTYDRAGLRERWRVLSGVSSGSCAFMP